YSTNCPNNNATLRHKLQDTWAQDNLLPIDLMLGNFNVEERVDKLPCNDDSRSVVDALQDLKSAFQLKDGQRLPIQ
ncbi:hypothetical protein BU17DRAFT_43749, partial [Hysterangium stoloniferum]